MDTSYSNKEKRIILEKINSLSSTEHEEILRIIKKNNITISQNKNGVFFNLSKVPGSVIAEINNFVDYCISNKKELDEYDKIINECKMNNKLDGMIPVISTSLTEMAKNSVLAGEKGEKSKDLWSRIKVDAVSVDKLVKFADKVAYDREKICKKKMNVKFNNAKKKFSRKIDRKYESDIKDILILDTYVLTGNVR